MQPFSFINLPTHILNELESPNWKKCSHVHDWKNYIGDEFRKIWKQLTNREKTILAYFAEYQADKEEWE